MFSATNIRFFFLESTVHRREFYLAFIDVSVTTLFPKNFTLSAPWFWYSVFLQILVSWARVQSRLVDLRKTSLSLLIFGPSNTPLSIYSAAIRKKDAWDNSPFAFREILHCLASSFCISLAFFVSPHTKDNSAPALFLWAGIFLYSLRLSFFLLTLPSANFLTLVHMMSSKFLFRFLFCPDSLSFPYVKFFISSSFS